MVDLNIELLSQFMIGNPRIQKHCKDMLQELHINVETIKTKLLGTSIYILHAAESTIHYFVPLFSNCIF